MMRGALCAVTMVALLPASPRVESLGALQPARLLAEMQSAYEKVDSYTATLIKQERFQETLAPEEVIEFEFQKPFKACLRWSGDRFKGQEIIYVAGENKGMMRGRRGGLLSFLPFSLSPTDPRALAGNHRPVTDAGIGRLIEILCENCQRGLESKEVAMEASPEQWQGTPCIRLQVTFQPGPPAYFCAVAVVHIDAALRLPIGIEVYDQPEQLYERYEYRNLGLNVPIPPERFKVRIE